MGIAIAFAATILAYLAGLSALFMGAGWLMSLAVLSGTGTAVALLLGLAVALRPDGQSESRQGVDLPREFSSIHD